METQSKKMMWTGRIMTGLAALPFLLSGALKLAGVSNVVQGFDHLGWPQS